MYIDLASQIHNLFVLADLKDLALVLDIDIEDFSSHKNELVTELVTHCKNHKKITPLIEWCKTERPNQSWDFALPLAENDFQPDIFDVPFEPYQHFIGRENEIDQIANLFFKENKRSVVISGIGGAGKTLLASQFAHQYMSTFLGGIFWLSFANPNAINNEIIKAGNSMNLDKSNWDNKSENEKVDLVKKKWKDHQSRLLIFDNCEDYQLFKDFQPPIGGCKVLVTSQLRWTNVSMIALDVLPPSDSVKLLTSITPSITQKQANTIAAELGYLPLAIYLAGCYLGDDMFPIKPEEYLEALQSNKQMLGLDGSGGIMEPLPSNHEPNIFTTFKQAIDRFQHEDETDSIAIFCLQSISCLAPGEPIPISFLQDYLKKHCGGKENLIRPALQKIGKYGVCAFEKEKGTLQIHRLINQTIQYYLKDIKHAEEAIKHMLLETATEINDTGETVPLQPLQTHLRHVTDHALETHADEELTADLCDALAYHLDHLANYDETKIYYDHALRIRRTCLGDNHPKTALSYNNMGSISVAQENYADALENYKKALHIRENQNPSFPESIVQTLNNLAVAYNCVNEPDRANECYQRAFLLVQENELQITPIIAANVYDNWASICMNSETSEYTYNQIEEWIRKSLELRQSVPTKSGRPHSHVARSWEELSDLYIKYGDIQQAAEYRNKAVELIRNIRGEAHLEYLEEIQKAAYFFYKIACALKDKGAVKEARPYYLQAQDYYKATLNLDSLLNSDNSMRRGLCLFYLGDIAHAFNELKTAKNYFEQSLEIYENLDESDTKHQSIQNIRKQLVLVNLHIRFGVN